MGISEVILIITIGYSPSGKFAHLAKDDDAENAGHIFSSGYFGHGQE